MQTIVILGAAGRVGDAACACCLAAGWRVKGVARNAKVAEPDAGRRACVKADAFDRASLIEACRDADVDPQRAQPAIHGVGRESDADGRERGLRRPKAVGATHMLPGNVYNFGYDIAVGTDAPMPPTFRRPRRPRSASRWKCCPAARPKERAVADTIVPRAGDFYGGTKPQSWLDLIILFKLRQDIFTWGGPADIPHAFAYLPDLGRAIVALAEEAQGHWCVRVLQLRRPHAHRPVDEGCPPSAAARAAR